MSDHHFDPIMRTARKRHTCIDCGGAIEAGTRYSEQRGFSDGAAYRNIEHPSCRSFYWWLHDDWGLTEDDHIEPPEFLAALAEALATEVTP